MRDVCVVRGQEYVIGRDTMVTQGDNWVLY